MHILKPTPIFAPPPKKICPVCGQASYSRDGVHPQCSMVQADASRPLRPRKKTPSKGNRFGMPKGKPIAVKSTHVPSARVRKSA